MNTTLSVLPIVTQQLQRVTKIFSGPNNEPNSSPSKNRIITDNYVLTLYDFKGVEKRVMNTSTMDILV
jgi:hypothetical protein